MPAVALRQGSVPGTIDLRLAWLRSGWIGAKGNFVSEGGVGMRIEQFVGRLRFRCGAAEHIRIVAAGTGHGVVEGNFERLGVKRQIRLMVPHFVAVGHILRNTDMIATVPEALAQRIAEPSQLAWVPRPVPLPEISIGMYSHSKYHRDAANQWLRSPIVEVKSGELSSAGAAPLP